MIPIANAITLLEYCGSFLKLDNRIENPFDILLEIMMIL